MYKDLRHTGDEVDNAVDKVETGDVVIENTESAILSGSKKPVAGGTLYQALANKVDKVSGKGLSTNDYTNEEKSRVGNSVTSIRVNDITISRKDDTGLLNIGDVSNLYVADFTINDLHRLIYDGIESLEVNGKALMQALKDHKAIGVLLDNGVPSMSLASVYSDDYIYLTVISDGIMYTTSVILPENYAEVEESKSGVIYKGETTDYQLGTYHQHLLDIVSDDVRDAYLNNQEITCEYNALRDAVASHRDIRIQAGWSGAVPVNAYIIDDTIVLIYIVEDNLWQITIYHSEDENGNVIGRVLEGDITNINLYDTKRGSRYIIPDFTLDTIIDGGRISVTSELIEAIKYERPLAIYEEIGNKLYNIEAVEANFSNSTEIYFTIPFEGGIQVEIRSGAIVVEGSFIDVVPTWHYLNDKVRVIRNANGDTLVPVHGGGVDVRAGFFSDKSVETYGNNSPRDIIPIRNQVTILSVPLTGNGTFRFQPPTQGTAVEYTIRFTANTQCSWSIANSGGSSLAGNFYGRTLSNISAGNYLMKITLYTYVDTKGNIQTEFIAEVMLMAK